MHLEPQGALFFMLIVINTSGIMIVIQLLNLAESHYMMT